MKVEEAEKTRKANEESRKAKEESFSKREAKKSKISQSETPVCSQFCLFAIFGGSVRNFGRVFAILFEVLLIEIQEEIHHFSGWDGGGLRGTKIVNKHFVNKLAFPSQGTVRETKNTVRSSSRSASSQAPRKLLLVDFGRKEYGYRTSCRGLEQHSRNLPSQYSWFCLSFLESEKAREGGTMGNKIPSHLRPVIIKPVSRILEIRHSKRIRGKCGKTRKVPITPEKLGSEEIPQSENAENADTRTRKMVSERVPGDL